MTAPTPPPELRPADGSVLDQLTAEYATIEQALAHLAEREKELKELIKAELGKYVPAGSAELILDSPYLGRRRLVRKESMRFETARFKKEQLAQYCLYAKKSVAWWFEKVK